MQRTQLIRRPRYNPTYNPGRDYSLFGDNPATQILIIALVALVIYLYLRNNKTLTGPITQSSTTEVRQITWNTDGLPTKIVTSHV